MCILLVGTTVAYIISAYFSSISLANDKFPSELPEHQMNVDDVEKRLNKLISYSLGISSEEAPQAHRLAHGEGCTGKQPEKHRR